MKNADRPVRQIPLPFLRFDSYDFESFVPGSNEHIVQQLQNIFRKKTAKNIYLWGKSGTGKSHLLQAVCTLAAKINKNAAYIPLLHITDFTPGLLEGLEQLDLVCIDDIDRIAGHQTWELAVFHLFNRLREMRKPLLMTAHTSPAGNPVKLPDLKSRLGWDFIYHIQTLTDEQLSQFLQDRARQRGFELNVDIAGYLVKHVTRDTHSLLAQLDILDQESLACKKKLTIQLVKALLNVTE